MRKNFRLIASCTLAGSLSACGEASEPAGPVDCGERGIRRRSAHCLGILAQLRSQVGEGDHDGDSPYQLGNCTDGIPVHSSSMLNCTSGRNFDQGVDLRGTSPASRSAFMAAPNLLVFRELELQSVKAISVQDEAVGSSTEADV